MTKFAFYILEHPPPSQVTGGEYKENDEVAASNYGEV
jgi:hypothetical protein